ncbi:MAG: TerB family tellurite resistance protein [Pseudomonadota bacterium]
MFESLFPRHPKDPDPLPQPNSQLALGALLMRVSFADKKVRQSELATIDRILGSTFDLGPIEAAKLRATCTDLELHATDTDSYATILRNEVPYPERKALVHAMWQVVLADGIRVAAEEIRLHEIERALGISTQDSAAAEAAALGNDT